MQEKIVAFINMFSNKLNNLVDSSNEEDIISYSQNRDLTNFELLIIKRNCLICHIEMNKNALERNIIAGYDDIDDGILGKNRYASQSEIEEEMNNANGVTYDTSFLYQRVIIDSKQREKKTRVQTYEEMQKNNCW